MTKKLKIFFDSSILIAASISSKGKSREILNLCRQERIVGIISRYVLVETERVLSKKIPDALPRFYKIIKETKFKLIDLEKKEIQKCKNMISDLGDIPVIAAAIKAKVDFLLTFDKRHFIDDPEVSKKSKLKIIMPKEFKIND